MTVRRLVHLTGAALAVFAGPVPVASAATVAKADWYDAKLTAKPGERNRVVVRVKGSTATFEDRGAVLRAGSGCTSRGRHVVVCRDGDGDGGSLAIATLDGRDTVRIRGDGGKVWGVGGVDLGSGDDRFRLDRGAPAWDDYDEAGAFGGAGRDVLSGGARGDRLVGGAGADVVSGGLGDDVLVVSKADVVRGGAGNDRLAVTDSDVGRTTPRMLDGGAGAHDLLSFASAAGPVTVDLQRDFARSRNGLVRVRDVEDVAGSSGSDSIAGDDGANRLDGLEGDDVLHGRGGGDRLIDAAVRSTCGRGADAAPAVDASLLPGCEHVLVSLFEIDPVVMLRDGSVTIRIVRNGFGFEPQMRARAAEDGWPFPSEVVDWEDRPWSTEWHLAAPDGAPLSPVVGVKEGRTVRLALTRTATAIRLIVSAHFDLEDDNDPWDVVSPPVPLTIRPLTAADR